MIKSINAEELRIKIGHNLATIRTWKKEKQEGVAKDLGIAAGTLSKIETGQYEGLTIDMLVNLCNHYKTTLAEVFDLGLTTVYNTTQPITVNSGGIAHPTNLKQVQHELSEGYLIAMKQANDEIAYLRKKLDDLGGSKG